MIHALTKARYSAASFTKRPRYGGSSGADPGAVRTAPTTQRNPCYPRALPPQSADKTSPSPWHTASRTHVGLAHTVPSAADGVPRLDPRVSLPPDRVQLRRYMSPGALLASAWYPCALSPSRPAFFRPYLWCVCMSQESIAACLLSPVNYVLRNWE